MPFEFPEAARTTTGAETENYTFEIGFVHGFPFGNQNICSAACAVDERLGLVLPVRQWTAGAGRQRRW
jgi:hypothetical protein